MALSNTAVPKYYGMFRDAVIRGEIPVNKEISMEMNRIDDLIANPGVYYDDRAVEGFIDYCESELTLTDGADLNLLDTFKLWAEQIFGWYYFVERSIYEPYEDGYGGHYITKRVRKRLINKQYLIVARGAAKSMYGSCLQNFFLNVDATTTHQITTAPTMKQAEEVLSPIRTSITRARGPYFKFLTEGSLQNTTGSKANRVKLSPTKKGKSVYDKRIVLDGSENWNISSSKPNSFLTPVSERIVNGLSDSYPTLKSPEIGTKNGIYLNYTADIIVTDLACSTVEEFKAHLSAHPLTVYYRSTAYDGTNGLDVCLTEYQTGYIESYADESITTAWISSTGALSTGAEVAYVLSSPETYATDPLDIDNAAGPLTVLTGGELEAAFKSADKVVESRIDFVEDTLNEQGQAIAEKAPISHSSDKSTYGLGSGSQFGHVKLSDATASGSNSGQGIAATPSAVNQVHAKANAAQSTANAAMPKAGGTFTGTVAAKTENIAGAYIRNISVQNSASQLQYTNFIIMVRK